MLEELSLTEEGLAEVERLRSRGIALWRDESEGDLEAAMAKSMERFAPAWERGLERCDDAGREAVTFVNEALVDGSLPPELTAEQAAWAASMLGAYESDDLAPFAELLLRRRGPAFCVVALAAMWGQHTNYHNPNWPRSEAKLELWAAKIAPDATSAQDASVSYGKARFARYLHKSQPHFDDGQREAFEAAVDALWGEAPFCVKVPLAVASDDAQRADELARMMMRGDDVGGAHYGWRELAFVARDPEALLWLFEVPKKVDLSLYIAERIGLAEALPLYEARLASKIPNTIRIRFVEQLAQIHGLAPAKIVARYAEKSPFTKVVRAYFVRFPELLEAVLSAPADDLDAERLEVLQKRVARERELAAKRSAAGSKKKATKKKAKKKAIKKKATKKPH